MSVDGCLSRSLSLKEGGLLYKVFLLPLKRLFKSYVVPIYKGEALSKACCIL
jgi:hypothetical protein